MSADHASTLIQRIRVSGVLDAKQLGELSRLPGAASSDPQALARALRDRGWLTNFQLNSINAGRGKALVVGPYVLLGRLGGGETGQVYKARHRRLGRVDAVKLVRAGTLAGPDAVNRFYQQAKTDAALHHPNLVLAHDAGPVGKTHYLASEYVEGIDLARLVELKGPLSAGRACEYVRQAALGLQHAHDKGLFHGDVKPSKLLVARHGDGDNVIKVLGVGLGRDADVREDLRGLGRSLFFLLTGKVPAGDDTPQLAEIPADVREVLNRLLTWNPKLGFESAAEAAEALAQCRRPARRKAPPVRGKRGLLIGLAGAGALMLLLVAGLAVVFSRGEPRADSQARQADREEPVAEPPESGNGKPEEPTEPEKPPVVEVPVKPPPLPEKPPVVEVPVKPPPVVPVTRVGDGRLVISKPGLNAAAYCLDGTHLVVTSNKEGVVVIDRQTGEERRRFGTPTVDGESRGCLAVGGDGRRAIVAHADRVPRLWDLETGRLLHELPSHEEPVRAVALSEDGRIALSAGGRPDGKDSGIRVWNAEDGKLLRRMEGHTRDVWQVTLSPDGRRAASVGWDHEPRLWDVETGKALHKYDDMKKPIARSVRFSPDGGSVLFGCLYLLAIECEAETGKEVRRYQGSPSWVWEAAFTPDGRQVVTASGYDNRKGDGFEVHDGMVRVYDARAGELRATLKGHRRVPGHLAMSPDSRHAVTTDHGGVVIEWELPTPRP